MSTSADTQSTDKEDAINEKSLIDADSKHESQHSVTENMSSEATQTESLSDWLVMICVLLCNILNGVNQASYGVLYLPITEMFQSSRAAVGWIQSFDFALGTFLGLFCSHPVNMFGCRRPATVGSLLFVIGGILSCFSPSLLWMCILKGVIPGIGQSMALLSCIVIIQQRFSKHRSFATGISVIGWSIGNFTGAPLTELLLNHYGLRGTLALLGALQSHRIPLTLQFRSPKRFRANSKLSDSDKKTTCDKLKYYIQGSFDFTLLRKTTFLLFCITGVLQKFTVNCYVPHAVNWALAAGVPRYLAVWAVSTLSCATTACRIVVSLIADRKWANRFIIFACGLFFELLMCIPPLVYPGIIGTYISVILFGFHAGCTHTIVSVVLVDLQGVEQIARSFALYCAFTSLSLLTGSPFMGLMYDITASYTVGFLVLIGVTLTALSLMLAIYSIEHLTKKKTNMNTITIVVESQQANTKC